MQENKVKNSQAKAQAIDDGMKLSAFLMSVPHGDYRATVDAILQACMIPASTFRNWRKGYCRIPNLHKAKINEIAQRNIF